VESLDLLQWILGVVWADMQFVLESKVIVMCPLTAIVAGYVHV